MINAVFGKTMETVREHRDQQKEEEIIWCQNQIIILIFCTKDLLAIEMEKTQIHMNKPRIKKKINV